MNDWKWVKLSEIIDFNPKERLLKGSISKKIAMEKIEPFTRDISEFERLEFKGGTKFRNGDTLIARITPSLENGKTAKVNLLDEDEIGFGSTEFIVARAKKGISDENFVYYLMLDPKVREVAIKSMVGTSGRQRVQLDVVKNYEILCPPLEEQIQIGRILSAIDDKIENNKKINHHLEEMIDAIFLRYIESSKQLEVKKLGELFDTKTATFNPAKASEEKVNHFSLPAFDASQYPLVDETNNIKSNKNIIKEYSVLFSKLNPSTKRVWVPFTNQELISVCSTEFVSLAGKDKIEQAILFAIINSQIFQDYFVAHATGTTNSRQRTKPSVAYEFEIPYNKNLLYQLGRTLSPLLTQLEDNLHQIHKITQIRNELLPKLLSGELSVTQAAK